MQVSNNIASFNVWKNYTNNVDGLRDSMSKLSSGSRINNAGDDPSGLAMSERLARNHVTQLQPQETWKTS